MRKLDILKMVQSYLYAALWTEELDSKYDTEDFGNGEQYYAAIRDCADFLNQSVRLLAPYEKYYGEQTESQLGHDFWLSRNGHGSGFFDLGLDSDHISEELDALGDKLQAIARAFPERNVFESEVGNIFIE